MNTWNLAWPDGKRTALTFSFDDGRRDDIRLVEILDRFGLKCTFNLNSGLLPPSGPPERHDAYVRADEVAQLYRKHEVAVHGNTHAFLTRLDHGQRCAEIFSDRLALEALVGYPVVGCAYAFGSCNAEVARDLEACGILYARTVGANAVEPPLNWLLWDATCHQNGFGAKLDEFEKRRWPWPVFFVWGHSYEFPRDNTWDRFTADCARAAAMPDLWPAANIEVYQYVQDFRRLIFAADGHVVRNPTARDLWLARGHGVAAPITRVPAGTTIGLE